MVTKHDHCVVITGPVLQCIMSRAFTIRYSQRLHRRFTHSEVDQLVVILREAANACALICHGKLAGGYGDGRGERCPVILRGQLEEVVDGGAAHVRAIAVSE